MPTAKLPPYPPEEIAPARRSDYEEKIRAVIESGNKGRRLVIDIETATTFSRTFTTRSPHLILFWNAIRMPYCMECGWATPPQPSSGEAGVCRMISGVVNDYYEPTIRFLLGAGTINHEIEAVVDTALTDT
jgi:hypothetical protein